MTKTHMLMAVWLVLIILGVGALLLQWRPANSVGATKANFNRIQKGMTEKDVEEIFGRPKDGLRVCEPSFPRWKEDGGDSWLEFVLDQDGFVVHKEWYAGESSLFEKITRWLGI